MPTEPNAPLDPIHQDGKMREDTAVPSASDDEVLEETARLAREGLQQREERAQREHDPSKPSQSRG